MHRGILSNCFMGGLRPIRSNYGSSRLHSFVSHGQECDRPGFSTLHTWHGRHIWRGTGLWAKNFLARGNSQTNPAVGLAFAGTELASPMGQVFVDAKPSVQKKDVFF